MQGKVFADKGYLSKTLLERLWQRGLHLVTSIRRNMKNYLMPLLDKLLLTPVSDKGMGGVRPHGLVGRCGKVVEGVLLWPAIWALQPLP